MSLSAIDTHQKFTASKPAIAAWRSWLSVWHAIFYVSLVLVTLFALGEALYAPGLLLTLAGLSVLLGIWYSLCMMTPLLEYGRRHMLLALGYLSIGWLLWFGLTLLAPVYLFVLFGLYPQVYFLRRMPWKFIDACILIALTLWRQALLAGWLDGSMFITLGAGLSGILLTLFIEAIISQSHEQHRLIGELERTRDELAAAERQAGISGERQRLAREIHDTLVQGFASIVMHLEAAEEALPVDTQKLQRHLSQARGMARENLVDARRLMWALQPEVLDHSSLPGVLTRLARNWSAENSVSASATITGSERLLRPEIEVTLLRAAQEALANAGKHAQASEVMITLSYMEDVVVLDVQDDGRGFDSAQRAIPPSGQSLSGFGLKALRERVEQLGGTCSIESTAGEGTTIAVSLPALSNEVCPALEDAEDAKDVKQ